MGNYLFIVLYSICVIAAITMKPTKIGNTCGWLCALTGAIEVML